MSIILFLAFSVLPDFMGCLLPQAADLISSDGLDLEALKKDGS